MAKVDLDTYWLKCPVCGKEVQLSYYRPNVRSVWGTHKCLHCDTPFQTEYIVPLQTVRVVEYWKNGRWIQHAT